MKLLERTIRMAREWPAALGAAAILSVALLPVYAPTASNLLERDLRCVRAVEYRLGREDLPGAEWHIALLLRLRPESPFVPEALLQRARLALARAERGQQPFDVATAAAAEDATAAYERAGLLLPAQIAQVERRSARRGVETSPQGVADVVRAERLVGATAGARGALGVHREALASLVRARRGAYPFFRALARAQLRREAFASAEKTVGSAIRLLGDETEEHRGDLLLYRACIVAAAARAQVAPYTFEAADAICGRYLALAPPQWRVRGHVMRARIRWMLDRPDGTVRLLDDLLAQEGWSNPERGELLLWRAVGFARRADWARSFEDAKAASGLLPAGSERGIAAEYHAAAALAAQGDPAAGVRLEILSQHGPLALALARIGQGMLLLPQEDRRVEAFGLLEAGIRAVPDRETLDRIGLSTEVLGDAIWRIAEVAQDTAERIRFADLFVQMRRFGRFDPRLYERPAILATGAARTWARRAQDKRARNEDDRQEARAAAAAYSRAAQEYVALVDALGVRLRPGELLQYLRRAGDRLFEGRLYAAAADHYLRAAQPRTPGWQDVQFLAGLALARAGIFKPDPTGRPGAAGVFRDLLARIAPTDPLYPAALLELGRVWIAVGEYEAAIETLQRAKDPVVGLSPLMDDPTERILRWGIPDWTEGVDVRIESERPVRTRSLWGLVDLEIGRAAWRWARSAGDLATAAAVRERALRVGLDALLDYVRREVDGRPLQAVSGEAVEALCILAQIHIARSEWDDAARALDRVVGIAEAPDRILTLMERDAWRQSYLLHGFVAERQGDYETARSRFERAAQIFPGHPDAMWAYEGWARAALELADRAAGQGDPAATLHRRNLLGQARRALDLMRRRLRDVPEAYRAQFSGEGLEEWERRIQRLEARLPSGEPSPEGRG